MKKHSPRPELPRSETRRGFIKRAGAATAFMIVPRAVLGGQNYIAPSDRLNIAAVGAAGKGSSDIQSVAHENIYAICDIDDRRLADTLQQYGESQPGLEQYAITKFGLALEVVPRTLAENAGMDATGAISEM